MAIYIYRRAASSSALSLSHALGGVRNGLRGVRSQDMTRLLRRITEADSLVCWGDWIPNLNPAIRALNNVKHQDKLADALALKAAGVATIETSLTKPVVELAPPPVDPAIEAFATAQELAEEFVQHRTFSRGQVFLDGTDQLRKVFSDLWLALTVDVPVPVAVLQAEWVGRMRSHISGNDLLNPPERPDFYVRKESIVNEYRVHSFLGRSIRAAKKVPADPAVPAHAWVRSMDGGWKLAYDGVSVKQRHRDIAHAAVKALGLDFGAVDIGERPDGSLIVFEVNRAPGLDGGTIDAYANAIRSWSEGTVNAAAEV